MKGLVAFRTTAVLLLAVLLPLQLSAQEVEERRGDPKYLSFGAGFFDVSGGDDEAVDFRLEYRHDRGLWYFKPWAGVELTSEGGLWGGGGVLLDIPLGRRFVLTGAVGAGGYEQGQGKDLGSTIMFRSQAELAYRFPDRSRLAVAFSHLSNAGIDDHNPGAEVVSLYYHVPLFRLTQALIWE